MLTSHLNVEVSPRSAWAVVKGTPAELDRTQDMLNAWAARLVRGSSWSGSHPQPVWLRSGPETLDVLLGAILAVGQQEEWELGLPSCIEAAGYREAMHARRELPSDSKHYLHDYQASAVLAALMAPWGRSILSVPTAGGKTRIACAIAAAAGGLWVYLAPNQELARQTQAEAPGNMRCYSFGTAPPGVLAATDGVLADECHRLGAAGFAKALVRSKARWRIGLSATPLLRSDAKNALVIGLLGPVAYAIDIEDLTGCNAVARGVVRNVLI